jgi:hypothetical protein
MTGQIPSDPKVLARLFANRGISIDQLAFYNSPEFLAAERADGSFLEFYGALVRARPRDRIYDAHVRSVVPRMAGIIADEIIQDGQLGVCIDASMMLTKMLEEQGIWCYAAKGALSVSAPELDDPTHFWMIDDEPVAGHVWVVAPPFEIVDVTLQGQLWQRGEAAMLPKTVVLETAKRITPEPQDFLSVSVLERERRRLGPLPRDFHMKAVPGLARPASFFPSWEVTVGATTLRYASASITVSDGPSLHAITSRRWSGRLAGELYDEVVRPALQADHPSPSKAQF